jgi:hypothetical protein
LIALPVIPGITVASVIKVILKNHLLHCGKQVLPLSINVPQSFGAWESVEF